VQKSCQHLWHFSQMFRLNRCRHTRPSSIFSGTTRVSQHQKGKTRKVKSVWIYWSKRQWDGIGISWAVCKSAPHPRHITTPGFVSYSTSVATMAVSRTVSEIHRLSRQKSPLVLGAPVRGEAVGAKQRRSVTKTRMTTLSGGKRISTKCLAVLIQSTR